MKYIHLVDTTLREGKQSSLNNLLVNKAKQYITLIDKMGIEYAEINHPYVSTTFLSEYRKVVGLKTNIKLFAHSAPRIGDLELLKNEGVKNISTFLIGTNENTLSKEALGLLDWGKKNNITLRISIENAFMIDKKTVCGVFNKICRHKAIAHLCLSDSTGLATPEMITSLLKRINASVIKRVPIELHFHNDRGLAAANFYAAYQLAEKLHRHILISVSLCGLGERNGIVSYGDVFSILSTDKNTQLHERYQTKLYKKLVDLIFPKEYFFNRDPLNPSSFKHTAVSHIKRVITKGAFEPVKPDNFGFSSTFAIGELFGTDALIEIANTHLKIEIPYQKAKRISAYIRNSFSKKKKNLTIQDLELLIKTRL